MILDANESTYGSDNDPNEQLFDEIDEEDLQSFQDMEEEDEEEEEPEVSDYGNSETDGEDLKSSTHTLLDHVREQIELDNTKFIKEFMNSNFKNVTLLHEINSEREREPCLRLGLLTNTPKLYIIDRNLF